MIREEICTYEVCKLAKEKGFNVPTDRYYHIYDDVIEAQNSLEMTSDGCADFYNSLNRCRCAAPTQSLLQRWLREEKRIEVNAFLDNADNIWLGYAQEMDAPDLVGSFPIDETFSTYELALEAALKFTLENLVV